MDAQDATAQKNCVRWVKSTSIITLACDSMLNCERKTNSNCHSTDISSTFVLLHHVDVGDVASIAQEQN
jgi:hypothetical protein